ncbi:MAG: hypothetical protein PHX08_01770 [Lachnospiraceae bacterium]|nr:hypothetical protein [Lachnospiraceae bacterium]
MQSSSKAYKSIMQSKLREPTEAKVYIGAINQVAQSGSYVSGGEFWKYSNLDSFLETNEPVEKKYFSWEENKNRIDGSMYCLPVGSEEIHNQGIITKQLVTAEAHPTIGIDFRTKNIDVKGMTILFSESYPVTFTITTNMGTWEFSNSSNEFKTEQVFYNVEYMILTPGVMSKGITRFGIESLLFGIGILLSGRKIISVDIKETTHPICLDLPTVDIKVEVDNLDRYFNVNSSESSINFLEQGQKMEVFFYQTLADRSREIIKGACAYLDKDGWKDKTTTAEFYAADRFYQMEGIYNRGKYRPLGITAYTLLIDVFQNAGFTEDDYVIDPYLKKITLYNPLPLDTHSNCIKLIANACRCVLRQDRDGRVVIRSSFIPDVITTCNEEAPYSSADKIMNGIEAVKYFDWQQGWNRIDGSMKFPPEGEQTYDYCGFISKNNSDANGNFALNPTVTFTAEAAFSFYQMELLFGHVVPISATIKTYRENILVEEFAYNFDTEKSVISHSFIDVDKVIVEFTKTHPNSKIVLLKAEIGDVSDFVIRLEDLFSYQESTKQNQIKSVKVNRTVYTMANEITEIASDELTVTANTTNIQIEFSEASRVVAVATYIKTIDPETETETEVVVDYGAAITEASDFYCIVQFQLLPQEATAIRISITGYAFEITYPSYVLELNTTGITPETHENPLINSIGLATEYATWIAEYYGANAEYSFQDWMGDPIVESNDLVYAEDDTKDANNLVRLHEVNIKFDGTLNSCSAKGRSVVDV